MAALVKELLKRYKNIINQAVVMDDYDAGEVAAYRKVVADLEQQLYRNRPSDTADLYEDNTNTTDNKD